MRGRALQAKLESLDASPPHSRSLSLLDSGSQERHVHLPQVLRVEVCVHAERSQKWEHPTLATRPVASELAV
jgi:hypothetical protein